ncbi:hypothetical protein JOC54_001412 [Alkalihalobacillus xiaoxiensis]|uniref:Uncharacterized protein n=1 Tax=Shouchella xiaoxiensis TaxID=766895 RepID=A0ABS2ST40_9BACI|nr:hypothetical protein [Shouchella xiaoxiensis]MBM7838181.1 hypothetical protein [Shouchella xiaoxiensis]
MRKHRWVVGLIASLIIVAMGFIIQVEHGPGEEERVIIDYTLNQYSAIACFDTAGFTNNIDETTYGEVDDHSVFLPESSCTAVELQSQRGPLWFAWFM